MQKPIEITLIERLDPKTFVVEWEHDPVPSLFSHYIVYKKQQDESIVQFVTTRRELVLFDTAFELIANENIIVAAFRLSVNDDNVVYFPTISTYQG